LIFAASLILAWRQIRNNRENQLRATAVALWDKYLDRTIQYPEFAYPEGFKELFDYENRTFRKKAKEFERYEWFVASLMRTSNEILCSYDRTDERNNMVRRNLLYHREYIAYKGRDFFQDLGQEVRGIVTEIANEHGRKLEEGKLKKELPDLRA